MNKEQKIIKHQNDYLFTIFYQILTFVALIIILYLLNLSINGINNYEYLNDNNYCEINGIIKDIITTQNKTILRIDIYDQTNQNITMYNYIIQINDKIINKYNINQKVNMFKKNNKYYLEDIDTINFKYNIKRILSIVTSLILSFCSFIALIFCSSPIVLKLKKNKE